MTLQGTSKGLNLRAGRRVGALGVLTAGLLVGGAGSASAATTIMTQPGNDLFSTANYTIDQGETPTFNNDDPGGFHDVTATSIGADKLSLFKTSTITGIAQDNVEGTEYLTPGVYHFVCTVHAPTMAANLTVTNAGTPVPRPRTALSITTKKLAKSGNVAISVTPQGSSPSAKVSLAKGSAVYGTSALANLQDGVKRTVVIKIPKSKATALRKKKKFALTVSATPRFGIAKSATAVVKGSPKKKKKHKK